ncbi:MAG: hypothetical protein AAGE76_15615 [Pseudomonadota bacterium]
MRWSAARRALGLEVAGEWPGLPDISGYSFGLRYLDRSEDDVESALDGRMKEVGIAKDGWPGWGANDNQDNQK